jgi:transcriptional regulator with XRE-family HTH domain
MTAPIGQQATNLNGALAAELRAERSAKRLTQAAVFETAGISKRAYINYESGSTPLNINQLHLIAAVLEVPAATLLARAEARLAASLAHSPLD